MVKIFVLQVQLVRLVPGCSQSIKLTQTRTTCLKLILGKLKEQLSQSTTKQTKWLAPSKDSDQPWHLLSLTSLHRPTEEALDPWLPIQRIANAQIRLDGCQGWSEFITGCTPFCWLLCSGWISKVTFQIIRRWWFRMRSRLGGYWMII